MSWYSSNYKHRTPISVDWSSWAAGATDVSVTVPSSFTLFWAVVQSSGYDVRFCSSDGETLLAYNRGTWDYPTKSGVFRVSTLTPSQACQGVIWMYWGYSSATDGSTAATANTPHTGRVYYLQPQPPVCRAFPERPGAQRPVQAVPADTGMSRYYWVDVEALLAKRPAASQGVNFGEEISEVTADVGTTADGAVAPTPTAISAIRIAPGAKQRGALIGVLVDGSKVSDATNYVLRISVKTAIDSSTSQTFKVRIGLHVQNVRPRS